MRDAFKKKKEEEIFQLSYEFKSITWLRLVSCFSQPLRAAGLQTFPLRILLCE